MCTISSMSLPWRANTHGAELVEVELGDVMKPFHSMDREVLEEIQLCLTARKR